MSDSEDEYGPPLPPGLAKSTGPAESSEDEDAYGPAMPPELHSGSKWSKRRPSSSIDDDDDEGYGPALPTRSTNDRTYGPSLPTSVGTCKLSSSHSNQSTDSESDSSSDSEGDNKHSKSKKQKTSIGPEIPDYLSKRKLSTEGDDSNIGPELPPQNLSKDKDSFKEKTSSSSYIGPALPPHLNKVNNTVEADNSDIGPELPPHLSKSKVSVKEDNSYIGPVLPPHLRHLSGTEEVGDNGPDSSESDDGMVGPSLTLQATGSELSSAAEFELRAQKMHDKLTGRKQETETEAPVSRESWMTELPTGVSKQFGLVNRNFRKKDAPEQDTSWTDTPQDKERKEQEGSDSKKRKKEDKYYVPTEKDRETAKEIDYYNKTNRPDSLLAMHEKKLKKKKKKEKKERKKNKKEKKAEERRPFDRDLDLQVNKFDDAQRKSIIKRSAELNTRFKTGGMGTSFL